MGIAILFFLLVIPSSIILIAVWGYTYKKNKKHTAGKILLIIWILFIVGFTIADIFKPFFRPVILTNKEIYGTYRIDKTKFEGKQANWQYDNFRLRITKNHLILESRIHNDKWKSEKVKISYTSGYYNLNRKEYCNRKIRIHSDSKSHHIIRDNPTLYREKYNNFYYVFKSEKFGNMFFRKVE